MILTVYQVVSQCRSPNKRGRAIWGAELKYHLMSAKTQCLFEPWKWLGPYLFLFVNALTLYPVNSLRLLFYRLFVGGRFIRGRDKAIHFSFEQPETLPIFLPVKYLFYNSLFCGCILIQPQRSFKESLAISCIFRHKGVCHWVCERNSVAWNLSHIDQ